MDKSIAGALFDFAAYLTGRDEEITLSAHHDASQAVKAIEEFANLRGLDIEDANASGWQDRTIMVSIACKSKICDQCQGLAYVDLHGTGKFTNPACNIFGDDLGGDEKVAYRCQACLVAEDK